MDLYCIQLTLLLMCAHNSAAMPFSATLRFPFPPHKTSGETGLRAEPPASGAQQSLVHRPTQAVWSEATQRRSNSFSNLSGVA
jgi:hypothetical protein